MIDKLLPCPFCGGEAKIMGDQDVENYFTVGCENCSIELDEDGNTEQAIKAWNTRAVKRLSENEIFKSIRDLLWKKFRSVESDLKDKWVNDVVETVIALQGDKE